MRVKHTAKWGLQIVEMIFQTRSSTQNNTSRMRESRKLEQKRNRQQQVRRQKIFLACSCLILTAGIGLFVTLYHNNHDQNIYTVYKLSDYTEELAASHGVHAESTEPFTLETLQEQYKKVLTQDYHTLG